MVLPLAPNKKTPLTAHGLKDASNDPKVVDGWWKENPRANIGICTGAASGFVVIDVDVKNGAPGLASLEALEEQFGSSSTVQAGTPSGGLHIFFKAPDQPVRNRVNFRQGIDIRGDGGYIVVHPSKIGGKKYEWVGDIDELSDLPKDLAVELTRSSKKGTSTRQTAAVTCASALSGTNEGNRNDLIFRLACKLRQEGLTYGDAAVLVMQAAGNCTPPLPEEEAMRCHNNAWGYAPPAYLTDLGNAERLVGRHGGSLRYVTDRKNWLVWDGHRWIKDADGAAVHRLAKETVRSIRIEAENEPDEKRQKVLLSHASKSESKQRLDAMVTLAARESGIPIKADALDTNDLLLGVQNGVVDLRDGSFRPAHPEDLVTKTSGAAYDQSAACSSWLAFLNTIFANNDEVIAYLQRMTGYLLTGLATERVFFVFHGDGANGKSTLVEVMRALLEDYAIQALPETFMATKWQRGVNNDIARLAGARFVSASESDEGQRLAEGLIKNLTGGDTVTARFLFREYTEFRSKFKLVLATNHLPAIRGTDPAIWGRLHLVSFPVSIPEEERDRDLRQRLLAELPGILNWAISGCLEWQSMGLCPPEEVMGATRRYREELDLVELWLAERTVPAPGTHIRSTVLYTDFCAWMEEQGEVSPSQREFGERMVSKGIERYKSNTYHYRNIELLH